MHLTTLTMKGFKSFASSTTLRFEPGITAVVGPNGSGKSNVVDAIAWVLGEQGAKALRGGKMEDVIFAGTTGRPPLGRAEVSLTIDNSDGALPIAYSEVSITRRMFRDGASEYEINGDAARLLDIQELLSDSGIGREMHVIVGQGQLDAVLQGRPEDRRGFIEEAAGVLKHRKRKEKALRKLDGLKVNLTRLTDLTAELRRQLKPLGRQAELARRAAGVQAELRDSRLRLLADDLVQQRERLSAEVADETAMRGRRIAVEQRLAVANASEIELEAALAETAPAVAEFARLQFALAALAERYRGTEQLVAERIRHLSQARPDDRRGREPHELEAEAERVGTEEQALLTELTDAQSGLESAVLRRQQSEQALATAERDLLAAARAAADRREGLATLTGRVNALRTRAAAAVSEIARISAAAEHARHRSEVAAAALAATEAEVGGLDSDAAGLDARYERAVNAEQQLQAEITALTDRRREHSREVATWTARRDALSIGLDAGDGAASLLSSAELGGVMGPLASLVAVGAGYETAIAAALGELADAITVQTEQSLGDALSHLKDTAGGRAALLVAAGPPRDAGLQRAASPPGSATGLERAASPPGSATGLERAASPPGSASGSERAALPPGCHWAAELVTPAEQVRSAVLRLLGDVVVVASVPDGLSLVAEQPQLRAVTTDGDLLGAGWAIGGSTTAPSGLEIRAEVDAAQSRITEHTELVSQLDTELARVQSAHEAAAAFAAQSLDTLHESDARFNAVSERLAELGQALRAATGEAERLNASRAAAESERDNDLAGLLELEQRLRLAESQPESLPGVEEPSTVERDRLAAEVTAHRGAEMDSRLAVRTREERVRALSGRVDQLRNAARTERALRAAQATEVARRERGLAVAQAVVAAIGEAGPVLQSCLDRAAAGRRELEASRTDNARSLTEVRTEVRELTAQLSELTDAVHRDELARAEQRLRIDQLETRSAEEFGLDAEALLAEYGPDQPVPASNAEQAEFEQVRQRGENVLAPRPGQFDRASIEKRAALGERDLGLLGKVNPLALEEFAALEERHQFLSSQLEDLTSTRRDLLTVVREVDDKILAVFAEAYADVAAEFELVFASLFPGGDGRLLLTDPDDMLITGIEIEARPPGKKVKRLSLLSGGERSLTAVALLVAIFRARPSPFYVMDEIEAALDDVNLGRLITLIGELRSTSQIIVITHQKRTMEIADALYGVTMRGDGISQVISQRLRIAPGDGD